MARRAGTRWLVRTAAGTALGVVALAGLSVAPAPSQAAPTAPPAAVATAAAAVDPLRARECFVPVMTQDSRGNVTYQVLGTPGGIIKVGLGKLAAGSSVTSLAGLHANGSPHIDTLIETGAFALVKGVVQFRPVSVSGTVRKARATVGRAIPLTREGNVRLIAGDWEPNFGGLVLMNFPDGTLAGRVTDENADDPRQLFDTQLLFNRKYTDLTSLTFNGELGVWKYYAQTRSGRLVRLMSAYDRGGERRIELAKGWSKMSRAIVPAQCGKPRRGEQILVAADAQGRFRVYAEVGGKLKSLGLTAGRATGKVL